MNQTPYPQYAFWHVRRVINLNTGCNNLTIFFSTDRRHINLRTELSQSELEAMVESRLAKIEQAYKQALSALEEKHLAERTAMLEKFNQEKVW